MKLVSHNKGLFMRRSLPRAKLSVIEGGKPVISAKLAEIEAAVRDLSDALAAVASTRSRMTDDSHYVARRLAELYAERNNG